MLRLDGRAVRKMASPEAKAFIDDVRRVLHNNIEDQVHDLTLDGRTYGVKLLGLHRIIVSFCDEGAGEVFIESGLSGMGSVCLSGSSPVAETAAIWDSFVDSMGW